jgi:dephospho-CoA kinase
MLQVGLTGNIASGKSHASCVFAELGARILDADAIAHELYEPGRETYFKVVSAFGRDILTESGAIDRRILGDLIFGNPEKRLLLNGLVHPDVQAEIMRRAFEIHKQGFNGILMVDAALMVESGFYRRLDRLIVIKCDPALQLLRVMNRSGLNIEQAKLRMESQMPTADKIRVADFIIDTSGTYADTRLQIERIYRELLRAAHPELPS